MTTKHENFKAVNKSTIGLDLLFVYFTPICYVITFGLTYFLKLEAEWITHLTVVFISNILDTRIFWQTKKKELESSFQKVYKSTIYSSYILKIIASFVLIVGQKIVVDSDITRLAINGLFLIVANYIVYFIVSRMLKRDIGVA